MTRISRQIISFLPLLISLPMLLLPLLFPVTVMAFDTGLPVSIIETIKTALAGPGEKLLMISSLFRLGQFQWNQTEAADRKTADALRLLLFYTAANGDEQSLTWIGMGMQSDGTSLWTYPAASSGFAQPVLYNRTRTAAVMFEESLFGRKSTCEIDGTSVQFCMRDWWTSRSAAPIAPPIGKYANYDPRTRSWYTSSGNDTRWRAELTTWRKEGRTE